MKTIEELMDHCRKNPGANVVVFPYVNSLARGCGDSLNLGQTGHEYIQVKVENPFFTEEAGEKALRQAANRLREAPQRLRQLSSELMSAVTKTWE